MRSPERISNSREQPQVKRSAGRRTAFHRGVLSEEEKEFVGKAGERELGLLWKRKILEETKRRFDIPDTRKCSMESKLTEERNKYTFSSPGYFNKYLIVVVETAIRNIGLWSKFSKVVEREVEEKGYKEELNEDVKDELRICALGIALKETLETEDEESEYEKESKEADRQLAKAVEEAKKIAFNKVEFEKERYC